MQYENYWRRDFDVFSGSKYNNVDDNGHPVLDKNGEWEQEGVSNVRDLVNHLLRDTTATRNDIEIKQKNYVVFFRWEVRWNENDS